MQDCILFLLEMFNFCEFMLQNYSSDYHLSKPKQGYEAQYAEWSKKRAVMLRLITWLEDNLPDITKANRRDCDEAIDKL